MSRNAANMLPAAAEFDSASRWQTLFGSEPPPRLPSIVTQAVAWREQVLIHGDVSATIAHDLKLAAEHALARRGVSQAVEPDHTPEETPAAPSTGRGPAARTAPLPPAASQLLPGSQLIKAYAGRNHIVTVEAEGFCYEGQSFTSLSAVAKHITGTHWNGLLFFGLRKRRSYAPKPRRHG